MKKIFVLAIIGFYMLCSNLFAQNATFEKIINLEEAGTLSEILALEDQQNIRSIQISGPINQADIAVLAAMSTKYNLVKIDLGNAYFSKTISPLLSDKTQYFLPSLASLHTDNIEGMEKYETDLGHKKDNRSVSGFWIFHTGKELFFMTGYMFGWDKKINEVVLKAKDATLLRSPQIRSWIKSMGYEYRDARTDGDLVFENPKTNVWCLLHFTPYGKSDYPGIHFSSDEYEIW